MQNVYTVGQVNSYIKNMFAQDFLLQELSVKGEVSNCKYHSSGHIYFTLKDAKGTISCVMFAGNRSGLNFRMAEGMRSSRMVPELFMKDLRGLRRSCLNGACLLLSIRSRFPNISKRSVL